MKVRITEYLDIDLDEEMWACNRCDTVIGPASDSYKKGCLVFDRDPTTIHPASVERDVSSYSLSPDPEWCRILEFYCPGCGVLVEVQYLPPGHPITNDIEIDIARLRERHNTNLETEGSPS